MISYQHLDQLKQLYLQKATGSCYVDPISITPSDIDEKIDLPDDLGALHKLISGCYLCDLSKSRRQTQVAFGDARSGLMIISDFPTLAEDNDGAYSGKSGEMLRKMIEDVLELNISDVYFTHAVKCMPASGKEPSLDECKSCQPFWRQQIQNIKPKLIVVLGAFGYNILVRNEGNYSKDKGKILPFESTQLIAIEHPKILVRNPNLKAATMQELLLIKSYLCEH